MRASAIRLVPFALLAGLGGARWTRMLDPAPTGKAWAWFGIGVGVGVALLLVALLPRRLHRVAGALIAAAALVLALLAAGLSVQLFKPARWDELVSGIGQGLQALPGMTVPYSGPGDGWPAIVVLCGGALLVVAAAVSAFWPRADAGRPWLAAVLLGVLSAVPGVVLVTPHAIVEGVLLFLGLLALLAADRVRLTDAPVAATLASVVAVAAALAFPAVDGNGPWINYEAAAQKLVKAPVTFSWTHTYGTLTWPRNGRELLRTRSARPEYWKAENLDEFDGLVWRQPTGPGTAYRDRADGLRALALQHPGWMRSATVTIRGLNTTDLIGMGETIAVRRVPHEVSPGVTPGTWVTAAELRDGDAYSIRSYVPSPSRALLSATGPATDQDHFDERAVVLPPAAAAQKGGIGRAARARVQRGDLPTYYAPAYGSGATAVVGTPDNRPRSASAALAGSAYAGVARLAARLKAGTSNPYAYVRAVERHLASRGFSYSESPPPATVPLAAFLLKDKQGYCQQFSGAMALLLRLGGVPARVASGFAPGTRDAKTGEWVIRDLDAHSWVEVWFSGIGWVTFDPTPASSPARGQETSNNVATTPAGRPRFGNLNKDLRNPQPNARAGGARKPAARGAHHGGPATGWIIVGALSLVIVAGGLLLAVRDRRRRRGRRETDRVIEELDRALRRTGRALEPATTLREVEHRFAKSSPEAAGYVRAVSDLRYDAAATRPTASQRRALRRALSSGLGPVGVARSWWAIPPVRRRT